MDKDEYIRRSLSKIRHKPWELYVISRIIHRLDDPDIEFVTQQLVRLPDGRRALTDMYFPQFRIHLEVNEGYHLGEDQTEADGKRSNDIVFVTSHEILTIHAAERLDSGTTRDLPLQSVNEAVEHFIDEVRRRKATRQQSGHFNPWDMSHRFDPVRHIKAGSISRHEYVAFRHQRDALRCFGYGKEKGHHQKGLWKIPDSSGDSVWFPRLFKSKGWDNELADNGNRIIERPQTDEGVKRMMQTLAKTPDAGRRIVFAKFKDSLGAKLFRYVGSFELDLDCSTPQQVVFNLIQDVENIRIS